jgi:hypothetical protein
MIGVAVMEYQQQNNQNNNKRATKHSRTLWTTCSAPEPKGSLPRGGASVFGTSTPVKSSGALAKAKRMTILKSECFIDFRNPTFDCDHLEQQQEQQPSQPEPAEKTVAHRRD